MTETGFAPARAASSSEGTGMTGWSVVAVVLAYAALVLAYFAPVLVDGRILAYDDAVKHYLPSFTVGPVLWSASAAGYPIYGDIQNMAFFPPKLVFQGLGLLGVPLATSYNLFVLAPFVIAASAAHVYVYRFTRTHAAAAVAGLVFALSSPLLYFVEWPDHAYGAAMLPLLALALERLRDDPRGGSIAWLAVVVGLTQLSGYPPMANVIGLIMAGYAVVRGAHAPAGRGRYYRAAVAGAALGIGLAAVQLVPTAVALLPKMAAHWTFEDFNDLAFVPGDLTRLFFPFITGGGSLYGDESFGVPTTRLFYLGLMPLTLGAIGLVSRRHSRAPQIFWTAATLYVVALALGERTPVAYLTYRLPVINVGHEWSRLLVVAAFGVAVSAGCGTAVLLDGRAGRRRFAIAGGVLMAVVGLWLLVQGGPVWVRPAIPAGWPATWSFSPLRNPAFGVPFLLALVASATVAIAGTGRRLPVWLVPALVLADLATFGYAHEWRTASPDAASLVHRPASLEAVRTTLAGSRQRVVSYRGLAEDGMIVARREHPDDRTGLRQEIGRYWGFETLEYFGKWTLPALGELTDHLPVTALSGGSIPLDLLAVRFVLVHSTREEPGAPSLPPSPLARALLDSPAAWRPAGRLGESLLFENRTVLPRAWVAGEARVMQEDAARGVLRSGRLPDGSPFDPARTALLAGPGAEGLSAPRDAVPGTVEIVEQRSQRYRLRVRTTDPSVLVTSDTYHPGWQVRVNDVAAPVLQADVLLRAVAVPAGESVVEFRFVPKDFYLGLAISVAALLVAAVVGTRAPRKRRQATA